MLTKKHVYLNSNTMHSVQCGHVTVTRLSCSMVNQSGVFIYSVLPRIRWLWVLSSGVVRDFFLLPPR